MAGGSKNHEVSARVEGLYNPAFSIEKFLPLLFGIVAPLAQGLQVVPVHHQRPVTVVPLDMVHNLGTAAAERACRVQAQELSPQSLPLARIAALAAVWSPGVMAAASGTDTVTLAATEAASGHNSTT